MTKHQSDLATKIRHCKVSIHLAKSTGEKALQKNSIIPYDWVHNREVLVGRRSTMHPLKATCPAILH